MRPRAQCLVVLLGACSPATVPPPLSFTAVTFNTGTTEQQPWTPDGGYGPSQAALSDQFYGDGLAWAPFVEQARAFFAEVQPEVVAFQEVFHSPDCASVPATARAGFVCERWAPGDPTVAQVVMGAGYQVGCNLGKPDKCVAVKRAFGTLRGCEQDLCLDALAGARVDGCGQGSRVGRGVIDLADGGALTVVHVHGTSGASAEDADCRKRQVDQVFVDLGLADGPAANGARNLILGDLNTDPGRFAPGDPSAQRWRDFAGPGGRFQFLTAMGPSAPATYGGLVNIDHVVSDVFTGGCWVPGVTAGRAPVLRETYFDHAPHVCAVTQTR